MPALFTLPKQVPLSTGGELLPGAKLHFFQTGTTTPQNTYQDIDLSTAHENPVVADASGVFPAIYLDASLPDYRVRLTNSADTQLWQLDDVPSGQDEGRTYRLTSDAPELIFEETDASENNKKWAIRVNSEALTIDLLNDAESVRTTIATFTRSGTTITSVNFAANSLQVNSEEVLGSDSEEFTATLTGMSAATTGLVTARKIGNLVFLVRNLDTSLTGTSNSTAMTMTGVPAGFRPAGGASLMTAARCFCPVLDSGSVSYGTATINDSGTITFAADTSGGAFTASGTKGIPSGWFIVFPSR